MIANATIRQARSSIVEGEFPLTRDDFRIIAGMLHADAGIALSEAKATLLYSRLAKRLRTLRLTDFKAYCEVLADPGQVEERRHMLTALTTNVTRFFREPHHFDHLRLQILPALLSAATRGGRIRIWSAACSTGQEPYSIALTIMSLLPNAASLDVRVLATDIDPAVLRVAEAGCYTEDALEPVPTSQRQRFFRQSGELWQVCDELREIVVFRELNLIRPVWPMQGPFDAIMCRNVLIYFAEETQSEVLRRFTPMLADEGTLYIGHSERLSGPAMAAFRNDGITTYRRKALKPGAST